MSALPPAVAKFLSSRAHQTLSGESCEEKVFQNDAKALAALHSLAKGGKLTLTSDQALDICVVFPGSSKSILSLESVISGDALVAILPALQQAFGTPPKSREDIKALRLNVAILEPFLLSAPSSISIAFLKNTDVIAKMSTCYDALNKASKMLGGGKWNLSDTAPEDWKKDLLMAKLSILGCLSILFSSLSSEDGAGVDGSVGLAFSLIESSASDVSELKRTPFVDRPLVGDYEQLYHLSKALHTLGVMNDDPRIDVLSQMIASVPGVEDHSAGGLSIVRSERIIASTTRPRPPEPPHITPLTVDTKGKGKSKADLEAPDDSPTLTSKINSIQSILPSIAVEDIRRTLLDRQYDGNEERVIEVLLDGGPLHPEPSNPSVDEFEFTKGRRNIFDDAGEFNYSLLRRGGGKGKDPNAGTPLSQALKADILRRAAEISDDESDDKGEDFDFNDLEDPETGAVKMKVLTAGEAVEDSDDSLDVEEPATAPSSKPDPTTILELAYIQDQNVFGRTSEIRRSKARAELRKTTGWSDEQIEGWKIMLERDPKKDKILQKHEFSGNVHLPAEEPSRDTASTPPQGAARGRGRGGGGRGSGGGGGRGDGGDKHQRARSEKHKAQAANHNRKRGHDRKMARGGASSAL